METQELTVYNIDELSQEAKQKAFNDWIGTEDYFWQEENEDVLYEFANRFPIKVYRYEYDEDRGFVEWDLEEQFAMDYNVDDTIRDLTGIRLMTWLINNHWDDLFEGKYYGKLTEKFPNGEKIPESQEYPIGKRLVKRNSKIIFVPKCLTGYYMGEIITQPIRDFLNKPDGRNIEDLIQDCIDNWLETCKKDVQFHFSLEHFEEKAGDMGWRFLSNGEIWEK